MLPEEGLHAGPGQTRCPTAAGQLFPSYPFDSVAKGGQTHAVASEPVIVSVAAQYARQMRPLLRQGSVSVVPAPLVHRPYGPRKAAGRRG